MARKIKDIVAEIKTSSIVSSAQGSWKWQDAYRITQYVARQAPDGRLLWSAEWTGGKFSEPQLRRQGLMDEIPHRGKLHNTQVSRADALACVGGTAVRMLEKRKWKLAAE